MSNLNHQAGQFRDIAASIRNAPHNREAIAEGFELIAASIELAMLDFEPVDTRTPTVIDPLDLPDLGREINADMSQAA